MHKVSFHNVMEVETHKGKLIVKEIATINRIKNTQYWGPFKDEAERSSFMLDRTIYIQEMKEHLLKYGPTDFKDFVGPIYEM